MQPDRRVPWLLVAAPYFLQQVVTVVLAVVLSPPSQASGALYSIRFGVVILASYAVLVGATFVVANRYGDPRELLAIRRTPVGKTVVIVAITFAVAALSTRLLEPIFHGAESRASSRSRSRAALRPSAGLALTISRHRRRRPDRRGAVLPRPPPRRAAALRPSCSRSGSLADLRDRPLHRRPRSRCCSSSACAGRCSGPHGLARAGPIAHALNNSLAIAIAAPLA